MKPVQRQSLVEQTATHVKEGLRSGRWAGVMPGTPKLAAECGVSRVTMTAALKLLENEGVLAPTRPGKARVYVKTKDANRRKKLRVAVLLRHRLCDEDAGQQLLYLNLRSDLEQAGHVCVFASRTQIEMRDQVQSVRRLVAKTLADAWIVPGPVREVAEWFVNQDFPCLFLGGFIPEGKKAASVVWDAKSAITTALRRLIELGHSRIVTLLPDYHQKSPNSWLRIMVKDELATAGVDAGSFHLPDWEETPEGLQAIMEQLFKITPPTALVLFKSHWTLGVVSFLCRKGLRVPEDVSLVGAAMDSNHAWHHPRLAYMGTSDEAYLRGIERWVEGVSKGREKPEKILVPGFFAEGDTVARAPKR